MSRPSIVFRERNEGSFKRPPDCVILVRRQHNAWAYTQSLLSINKLPGHNAHRVQFHIFRSHAVNTTPYAQATV